MHHVAYCFDENYQQHFAASLSSLVASHGVKVNNLKVHIVTDTASNVLKTFLESFSIRTGLSYHLYCLGADHRSLLEKIPLKFLGVRGYLKLSAYFRIMLPILIGDEIQKLLYLDSDTIVVSDVSDIFDLDLAGKALGAVPDASSKPMSRDFGYQSYFNSGVMVMDLDLWRKQDLAQKCLEYVWDDSSDILYADQCAINRVLSGNITEIPNIWNRFVMDKPKERIKCKAVMTNAAIIHFITDQKPWFEWYENALGDIYLENLSQSQWPNPVFNTPMTINEYRSRARKLIRMGKSTDAMKIYESILDHLIAALEGHKKGK